MSERDRDDLPYELLDRALTELPDGWSIRLTLASGDIHRLLERYCDSRVVISLRRQPCSSVDVVLRPRRSGFRSVDVMSERDRDDLPYELLDRALTELPDGWSIRLTLASGDVMPYVDTGTKWQRNYSEDVNDECPDCDGDGYSR